ncbi:hypothetical protein [Pelagibius sp.]|uniref:hypothetical protein n=1 Tax=Pelagibius sp. TaxID=1931238 RepID=UPI003BB07515
MSTPIASSYLARLLMGSGSFPRSLAAVAALAFLTTACSSTGMVTQTAQWDRDCASESGAIGAGSSCENPRNVLVAMASGHAIAPHEVVEKEILEEQRGGFITAGGLQVDFGFEFRTFVNGIPQLTSVLSLNDIVSGNGVVPNLNSISVAGSDGGLTDIIHAAGPDGISATILNTQDGVQIENISTLAIDIIGLRHVHKGGRALGNGRRMPMETQQSIIRSLSR